MKILKKFQYNSPVVLSFALLSFGSLVLGWITNGWTTTTFFTVYRSSPWNPLTYVRLFGHVLGHADWQHYSGNMLLFLLLGPMLEEKYGSKRLLEMIALTALITGIINCLFFRSGLLGASGVIFMLIILSSMVRLQEGRIPLTMIIVVILYLGQELAAGLLQQDNISQLTHMVGGVCGGAFGYLCKKRDS